MVAQAVSLAEWEAARAELLIEEKAATKRLEDLATKRRQLPMVFVKDPLGFRFAGPDGEQKTLVDLFEGKTQLILYNFMISDKDKEGCPGCSFVMDHVPTHGHLAFKHTSFAAIAPASIEKISAFKERMGWAFPFYSCKDTFAGAGVAEQSVVWRPENDLFGFATFWKDGKDVYHTYSTGRRGVESVLSTYALLDMTHLGRQEEGRGMEFPLHDKY